MATNPIITFKAGSCDIDQSTNPHKVVANPTPGYIYLYAEEDLIHFCWRERNKPMDHDDNLDLVILPSDCRFVPYEYKTSEQPTSKTNGRIFVLKFSSSPQRYLFWLQSKPQISSNPSHFSARDLKIGHIVDSLLQGDQVDVPAEIAGIRSNESGDNDEDETMEDVEGHGNSSHQEGTGGAGPDATGGDIREEGASAREGGADGGRAAGSGPTDANTIVQNFLNSLKQVQGVQRRPAQDQIYTTLPDLLPSSVTGPIIESATQAELDNLLGYLPPTIILMAQEAADSTDGMAEVSAAKTAAAMEALSLGQKKDILKRVLRSPQFNQSLGSLTMAIRDGGLPSISEALGINVMNGGLARGSQVPLGGGDAVEAFITGVKRTVQDQI